VLPARLTRLPCGFAIILVGKAIPPAATFAAASAIATAATVATTAARTSPATRTLPCKSAGTRSARRPAFALRARFIYFQVAPASFFAVQTGDCLCSFRVVRHFYERESTCPARFAIHSHMHARHLPKRLEQRSQIAFGRLEIHIPNKKTFHVASPGFLMRR
jgi:hypothetical protein